MDAKKCSKCGEEKPLGEFHKNASEPDGFCHSCKPCKCAEMRKYYHSNGGKDKDRARSRKQRNANPAKYLWQTAKRRAKRSGVPFSITVDDVFVPDVCPVLGIRMSFGSIEERSTSPSIDRINPELGYVQGNIIVISQRANRMKNDATLDELRALVGFYEGLLVA